MVRIAEIAPGVFQLSLYVAELQLPFNHFLVVDDEPLLFHTGHRRNFELLRQALALAPRAQPLCGMLAARTSVADYADRPPRALAPGELVTTGTRRFAFQRTPHVPHGWEAGLLFEETGRILFCSDLLGQRGDLGALTRAGVAEASVQALSQMQAGPMANSIPYTPYTDTILRRLAALRPALIAPMHGPAFEGDGERELQDYAQALAGVLGSAQA
jgi:flavorubredoxin